MLEARALTLGHPGAPPLFSSLDFSLGPGEQVALTGANGCGKSSLCLALAGLLVPRSGAVLIDGEPCRPDTRARSDVAILFQEPDSQLVTPSVTDELAFPLENLGWERTRIRARVHQLMEEFGLASLGARAPESLSGGEKSRLALAAALAAGPRYLILDEPEVYLDAAARLRLRELLGREVARGAGVLWVTQWAEEWAAAGRRLVLADGRLSPLSRDALPFVPEGTGVGPPAGGRESAPPGSRPRPSAEGAGGPRRLVASRLSFDYRPGASPVAGPLLIHEVDLEVAPGETVFLHGPSGSGKTTLLLLLAGVLEPVSGSVAIHGPPVPWPADAPPPVGVVLQSPEDQLVQPTVLEDVELGPRLCGRSAEEARRSARAALDRAGLDPDRFGPLPPSGLSLGQRRRAAWAGIWAAGADLWLLDEPTAGLDREGVSALEAAVSRFTASGGAAVIVNQDPRLRRWAGRRLRLEGGRIAPEASAPGFTEPNCDVGYR